MGSGQRRHAPSPQPARPSRSRSVWLAGDLVRGLTYCLIPFFLSTLTHTSTETGRTMRLSDARGGTAPMSDKADLLGTF